MLFTCGAPKGLCLKKIFEGARKKPKLFIHLDDSQLQARSILSQMQTVCPTIVILFDSAPHYLFKNETDFLSYLKPLFRIPEVSAFLASNSYC